MANWEEKIDIREQTLAFFLRGIKAMWELLGEERKRLIRVMIWIAALEAIGLAFNLLLKMLFDEIPHLMTIGRLSWAAVVIILGMLAVKLLSIFLDRFALEINFLKSIIQLENRWPVRAQRKLLELSLGYHEKENTGKKIDKINKGCERLVDIVGRLRWGFLPPLFYAVFNLSIIMFIDWRLGLLFFAPFIPAGYLYLKAFQKVAPSFEKWETLKEKSAGKFCQSIICVQTVQNCVQEEREQENFAAIRRKMTALDTEASVWMQKYFYFALSLLYVFFIATIVVGIFFVLNGLSTPGTIVYIIATGGTTFTGLWHLINEYTHILRRMISVLRMKELLDEKADIRNAPGAFIPKKFSGQLELNKITFTYPGKNTPVIKNMNFLIRPGEMIAFAGRSGEGKTTLVKLICRMFDPQEGAVMLDGRDIRGLDLYWYRKKFAIVQQDVDIFDASILDNIRYAYPDAPETKVRKAVNAAYLQSALKNRQRFPHGLSERVGERGIRLSGGEKQRVGIARAYLALLYGAKVLILDEATSNLDSQAERAIQKMLNRLRAKRSITVIAIAHRLSTIQMADMIYVINGGGIVEQGNHNKLLVRNGLYANLVALQQIGELRK